MSKHYSYTSPDDPEPAPIAGTHWENCWDSGPEHYECALAAIERLLMGRRADSERIDTLRREALQLRIERDQLRGQAEKAEAERDALRADAERLDWLQARMEPVTEVVNMALQAGFEYRIEDDHLIAAAPHGDGEAVVTAGLEKFAALVASAARPATGPSSIDAARGGEG